jgi:hypothetical protein
METLSNLSLRKFEDRMAAHLERCFPAECRALGPDEVRQEIRYGIQRASTYGIDLERDVCRYIDLMFAFGRDFDMDPRQSWAGRILKDDSIDNATAKVERLYSTAKEQESMRRVN